MSFELFVQAFQSGDSATFPRTVVEELFGPFIRRREAGCWVLGFADGGEPDIYLSAEAQISGFMVSRPPSSPEFWTALLEVLRRTSAVCYWPGCERPVVADASAVKQLPADMLESLGEPVEVTDGATFLSEVTR